MKCPNCGQEMIDIKDYCVACGKKLKEKEKGISLIGLVGIFAGIIVATVFACYYIINHNTEEELEPYLDKNITEKTDNQQ